MDKYIPDNLRKQCYFDWVKVRRCASNNIGDAFAMHLNVSRALEDQQNAEEEQIRTYEKLMQDKFNLIKKELKIQPEEGEAEGEGQAEEETAAEESSEEAPADESADETKTEEVGETKSGEAEEAKADDGEVTETKTEVVEESSDNAIEA